MNWLRGKPRDGAVAASDDALAPEKPISHVLVPFHWEIEFPEVFGRENPGFDAIVGNPPFLGGSQLSELFGGPGYQEWLKACHEGAFGNADLSAYFFRRAFDLVTQRGAFGFVATKTISEGDTRTTGLKPIVASGGRIYDAVRSQRWPGDAAVLVVVIHIAAKQATAFLSAMLDGRPALQINSRLFASPEVPDPVVLRCNSQRGFMGTGLGGSGFILDATEYSALLSRPVNAECIQPLLGGEEFNRSPTQSHDRYAINFRTEPLEYAERFPDLLHIVRTRVKPARDRALDHGPGKHGKKYWWQYTLRADPLYRAIESLPRCLVTARITACLAFAFQPVNQVFSEQIVAFALPTHSGFACLQAQPHHHWSYLVSSYMGDTLRYSVSEAFHTFPFPETFETDAALEAAGKEYYEFRAALMVRNDEGLTKTYNRFHDPSESSPEIAKLRDLHAAMDRAVLDAYHWADAPTTCGFALDWLDLDDDELADTLASAPDDIRERIESADYFFPDAASACRFQANIKKAGRGKLPWRYRWPDEVRDDVLARLLALNAERAELERLTGLPGAKSKPAPGDDAFEDPETEAEANTAQPSSLPVKKAKKASKRASKKSAPRPMFDEDE